MRSIEELRVAQLLIACGLNDCEVSRTLGIPRRTILDWRHGRTPGKRRTVKAATGCPDCGHTPHDFTALPAGEYAYLLGLYLGDGCISKAAGRTGRLRIFLDQRYPAILNECAAAMEAVIDRRVGRTQREGCIEVGSYSKQWYCLFPQHGPGRKHERSIVLTDWQQAIVDKRPEALLRGLIHSDGWRGFNKVKGAGRIYAYPRYQFSNKSEDIKRIFCDACDAFGVEWRRMNAMTISVAKRASVARLDEVIGPKA